MCAAKSTNIYNKTIIKSKKVVILRPKNKEYTAKS